YPVGNTCTDVAGAAWSGRGAERHTHRQERHRDVGDIKSRLLDHRPVINAETRFFVKEFEEKRGNRESRLLENLNKMVREANDQIESMNLEETNQHQLQANMEKLKEDWSEFLKEQQVLKEEVDEEHAKAVGELGTRFSEKKKDLAQYSFI
uniref:Biogenesis of lysosome-related organelles complex 1 subunit 5 n=1 Tax=Oryzias latipes TaxID=8090 RepID=A0A3B3IJ32_ORYLA